MRQPLVVETSFALEYYKVHFKNIMCSRENPTMQSEIGEVMHIIHVRWSDLFFRLHHFL